MALADANQPPDLHGLSMIVDDRNKPTLTDGLTVLISHDSNIDSNVTEICVEVKVGSKEVIPDPVRQLIEFEPSNDVISPEITFKSSTTQVADEPIPVNVSIFLPNKSNFDGGAECKADQDKLLSKVVKLTDNRGTDDWY